VLQCGLYFDLRNPPAQRCPADRVYGFTLEVCEEADRLGIPAIWLSEHHAFDDGYLPAATAFAAAVAARTKRARIGTALVLAPLRAPAQLAEEAAVIDLISGGRFELGLGPGYRRQEFDLYGASFDDRRAVTVERARTVRQMLSECTVTPSPAQSRLPIWLGFQGPVGARAAGRLGEYLLSPDPKLIAPYSAGLAEAGLTAEDGRMGGNLGIWVSEDPERDWPAVRERLRYTWDSYGRHAAPEAKAARPSDPDRMRANGFGAGNQHFVIDTPERVAEHLVRLTAQTPISTVFFFTALGGMHEEMVREHVTTIGSRLVPLLNRVAPAAPGPAVSQEVRT
jgi:alkanesulfonate monooxygenase SsuD/methylene tetrahydromethanopterin reductase-like flavin-dependent oxidoreductase (luciferase family)